MERWMDESMQEKCYFNKAWVAVSSSRDFSLHPATTRFPPHLKLSSFLSFTNTWAPDDWLQHHHSSGFAGGAGVTMTRPQ